MTRWLPAACVTLVALLLAGCGTAGAGKAAGPGTRVVTTAHGPVNVPSDPQRIVVLSGGQTGYLYELGVPVAATDTRVLGIPSDATGFPPTWSADATRQGTKALPGGDELSIEAVAAQRPDLIIGGGQGITGLQAEQNYDKLSKIAPTVLVPNTVVTWQEELRLLADAVGRSDRVPALMRAYTDKVATLRSSIKVPPGPAVILLSLSNNQPCLVPADAALATLLRELGFVPDDVLRKAGNPPRYGTGDSFVVSAELVSQVADAPTAFVIPIGGRSASELAKDPLYAQLPAFRAGRVHELPALSYRPDYRGVIRTLDVLGGDFR
ncbi:ABC transporter substrate-binding protein [Pseudonocardia acaciae]|uniref:ABC transporter substrate-binding protein n=1 Tax=Pseudonocardia acaciae TaxID=551276 RepID=UPI00048AA83E|nr:ABC transporter substrate-binding protein [Pseudonocardia acaciae]